MPRAFRKTGYAPPSKSDIRNFSLEKAQAVAPFPVVYKTDISALPVFDQDKIPDCVENAITYVKKFHTNRDYRVLIDLSRRFLAILTVKKDGFPIDSGTSIQNALYVAHTSGICESKHLADDHTLSTQEFSSISFVSNDSISDATNHKIASYAFLSDLSSNGLKNAIHQNGVVVVGALINQNWWTDVQGNVTWDKGAILPIRPPKTKDPAVDTSLSGHCFVLYGYDEQYFYFVNSFGNEWGDNGLGYFKIDELPFIYEAATVVDLSPVQIETIKNDIQAAQQIILTVDPTTERGQEELGIISRIVLTVIQYLSQLLRNEGSGGSKPL